jgi:hypothetical protein
MLTREMKKFNLSEEEVEKQLRGETVELKYPTEWLASST